MPLPWLRLIDGVIGATDVLRWVRGRAAGGDLLARGRESSSVGVEARLAGAVVGALREAFDRDHERLDLERQRMDEERRRAERALRLELQRQAGDRAIGRLRLVAGIALIALLGSLLLGGRIAGGSAGIRVLGGLGGLLLVAALAASLAAQARVARTLARGDDRLSPADVIVSGAGAAASWLMVAALAALVLAASLS